MTRLLRRLLLSAAIAAISIACGEADGTISPGSAVATWDPQARTFELASVLRYRCGEFDFEPSFLEHAGHAEDGNDAMAAALRAHLATPGIEIDSLPDRGWLLVGANESKGQFISRTPDGRLASVHVEKGADGWKVTGWGGCGPSLVLPPGLGTAAWRPNPRNPPPDAQTTRFGILVTERSCASGASSKGRVVGPAVRFEDDRILVVYAVIPQAGGTFDCQSNPATGLDLDLGQPLGDRELIDATLLPWVDVRTIDPAGW